MNAKTIQKYNKYTVSKLIKKAQEKFNRFIRERDLQHNDMFVCISCKGVKPKSQMNAGHYYPAGTCGALRFNENNVHGQCIKCNYHQHGNLTPYRKHLIEKIGLKEVERLDMMSKQPFKHDRIKLIELIEQYK